MGTTSDDKLGVGMCTVCIWENGSQHLEERMAHNRQQNAILVCE